MVSTLKSFGQYFGTYPLRGILTLLTIAIGVGALIMTFSLSFDVTGALEQSLSAEGRRIVIANATIGDDGDIQRTFPPEFDANITTVLGAEYENLRDITMVGTARWDRVAANDTSYQVRSAISAGAAYARLMNLQMIAGSFYTQDDVDARSRLVVISDSTARILFGSADAAVGQAVEVAVPTVTSTTTDGRPRMRMSQQPYTVVGVFNDVSDLEREAFGVGDFIIPIGTNIPEGFQISFDPTSIVMARLVGDSVSTASSRIGVILGLEYGDDAVVSVWEGSPSGPEPLIEESRTAVRSFALTINVLGVIILFASSIGIFSIMLVEVLNRMREIGLRRAIGATQAGIRRFFMMQAVYFSLTGGAIGIVLSLVFYKLVGASLLPFFETTGLSAADLNLNLPGIVPIVLALAAALVVGALFGFFPAISASRTPIVECIREEAA